MHADTATCMHAVHNNLPVFAESMHTQFDNLTKCTRNHCCAAVKKDCSSCVQSACDHAAVLDLEPLCANSYTMSHALLICIYICVYVYVINRIWNAVII
jgi:hypothetical protein